MRKYKKRDDTHPLSLGTKDFTPIKKKSAVKMLIYVTLMSKGTFTVSKFSKGTYLNSKGTETTCEKSIKKKYTYFLEKI